MIYSLEERKAAIVKPIEEELKKPKIDWSKVNAYFQTLVAVSAMTVSLLTPELRIFLGLK